jgi:hypothetical protein
VLLLVVIGCVVPAIPTCFARVPIEAMVTHVVKGLLL